MDRRETTVTRPSLVSLGGVLAATAMAALALVAVVLIALRFRETPTHCGWGLESLGPACCAEGQRLDEGVCTGAVTSCPAGMVRIDEPRTGCIVENRVIDFDAGRLELGPMDWEAQGLVAPRSVAIEPFSLDSLEVTVARWHRCVIAQTCKKLGELEPGLPVTGVTPAMAERFCLYNGGRLPTSDEWLYAAAGNPARRYPWGNTGLVCRRAVFGVLGGPCASGAVGPTLAGSRPSGRTPEGLFDMAGNVAELTVTGQGKGKGFVARGGSFRSTRAAELKSWAEQSAGEPSDAIGFRCAYDAAP